MHLKGKFSGAAPVQQRHGRGSGEALAHRREAVPEDREDKVEVSLLSSLEPKGGNSSDKQSRV